MHFYVSRLQKLLNIFESWEYFWDSKGMFFSSPFQMLKYPHKEIGYDNSFDEMSFILFF